VNASGLTAGAFDRWNELAASSDDAWFWQTTDWMKWIEERWRTQVVANRSFLIAEGADVLAVCPVLVEQGERWRQFGYGGGPLPFPAIKNGVGRTGRQKILGLYAGTLATIALRDDVKYVCVKVPSLSPAYLRSPLPFANALRRFGYFDLPHLTQLVDLRPPLGALWSQVRKGHKADIKSARRMCRAHVWDRTNITTEKFREYERLHAKDAGRVVRSQATFDLMRDWVVRGMAALVEAEHEGRSVAFALHLLYKDGAFYASGCKDSDLPGLPASHLVQWVSIEWLKDRGYQFYDIGLQQFGPQWFEVPGVKDVSIARFKRGFGGQTVPLVTTEFFYSPAAFEETFTRRIRAYLDACAAVGATT